MTEHEMEDLLWSYPESLLNEKLEPVERQPSSSVGRVDLVFRDRVGNLLVIEIKRGTLKRGAIGQLYDYFGMVKTLYPSEPVELMVVANVIPKDRKLALERNDIGYREVSEKEFRDVAKQNDYVFESERVDVQSSVNRGAPTGDSIASSPSDLTINELLSGYGPSTRSTGNKAWYYLSESDGHERFLAFVNARGSCSIRAFDTETGYLCHKDNSKGDFQEVFESIISKSEPLTVSSQPNLEHANSRTRSQNSVTFMSPDLRLIEAHLE